jgi:hypothetical protein
VTTNGDLITDILVARLDGVPVDERVTIHCDGYVTQGIFPADHGQPNMTFVALAGSSGFLEFTLVGDSAGDFFRIQPGAVVTLDW